MADPFPTDYQAEAVLIVETAANFLARVTGSSDEALRLAIGQLKAHERDIGGASSTMLTLMRTHITVELRRRAEEDDDGGQVVH